MMSNLCLLEMNAYILHKHLETDGFDSSGVSLILNVLSFVLVVLLYVLFGIFCGHGPLFKICAVITTMSITLKMRKLMLLD